MHNILSGITSEFKFNNEGQAFISIRGLARLCGVSDTALHKANANLAGSQMGVFLASKGFEGSNLITSEGIPDTVATLIIEYYAFEAGRYITEQAKQIYRAFAAIGFRTWVQQELNYHAPDYYSPNENLAQTVINVIDMAFKDVNINPALIAGCKLNAAAQVLPPEAASALNEGHKLLAATTTIPDRLLTATELGQQLGGISARKVNKMLIDKGLQVKNLEKKSKGSSIYIPTERGHEFCDFTIATGKGKDNSSFQSLKWYPSVARVIES